MKAYAVLIAAFLATTLSVMPALAENVEITAKSSTRMAKGIKECVNQRCIGIRIEEGRKMIKRRPDYKVASDVSKKIWQVIKKCEIICSDKQIAQVDVLARQMQSFSESKKVFSGFGFVGYEARERVRRPFSNDTYAIQKAIEKNEKQAAKEGRTSFWSK